MLPVSLACPFLIAPSVFSNVYLTNMLMFLRCKFVFVMKIAEILFTYITKINLCFASTYSYVILFCRNVSQYSVFLPYTFSFCSVGMSHSSVFLSYTFSFRSVGLSHSTVCSCRTFSHSVLSECLTVQCVLTVHFLILFCRNVSQYSVFLP